MRLFIQIKDGMPFEHPIMEDNFIAAFPEIDVNNLPENFAKFERIPQPNIKIYQVYEGATYEWDNNIVKDVHHIRDMTLTEKTEKQNFVKSLWAQNGGYPSWIFDEEKCTFIPPVPYPNDDKSYIWDEETQSWAEV